MKSRSYQMSSRARTTEDTGRRVLDAMLGRFATTPYDQIKLDDVAADAQVTVQTVLRRFDSKAGLMTEVVRRELGTIMATRAAAAVENPERIVTDLCAHYERYGDLILKAYAEAPFVDGLGEVVDAARTYHLSWCRDAFAPHIAADFDRTTRTRRLAQLTALCDAATWRILRRDLALGPVQTRRALLELVLPLVRDRHDS